MKMNTSTIGMVMKIVITAPQPCMALPASPIFVAVVFQPQLGQEAASLDMSWPHSGHFPKAKIHHLLVYTYSIYNNDSWKIGLRGFIP